MIRRKTFILKIYCNRPIRLSTVPKRTAETVFRLSLQQASPRRSK